MLALYAMLALPSQKCSKCAATPLFSANEILL